LFIDVDSYQIKKHGQNAYGDYFISKRKTKEERLIAVLSDGLGSGIKANILARMTATMLLRFVEEDIKIKKAAEIMMNSLPVCKERQISYATFSVIDCDEDGNVHVVEEGNPDFVLMRGHNIIEVPCKEVASKSFPNRRLKMYKFKAELGDRLIFCSDGVTQAGLGENKYKLGWRRSGLVEYLERELIGRKDISSTDLSKRIVYKAQSIESFSQAKDDISACVIYFRTPRESLIFTGPPYNQDKDGYYAKIFDDFDGKKAICGGTTANIISRELGRFVSNKPSRPAGDLPPTSSMDGADLITEGILTLTRAMEYLDNATTKKDDAAGDLVDFMLSSDVINIMMGAKLNQAHYDPALPIEIEIRRNIIKKIADILESKYFKKVNVQYI
jgi:serine/threonine protein phosphatase PrpC